MNKLLPLLLFVVFISCSGKKPADLVITGGTIYTMDASQPVVEAVVVNEDTIVFAGTAKAAAEWIGDNTNVIELQGKTMVPGFIEGHGHFMGVGYNELDLDLSGVKTFDEIVERVRIAASKAKPGEWILGRGWHQDKWDVKPADMVKGYPSHAQLSAVSPDNPVFLSHASGHMSLANAKAMEIAGVNQLSKESLNKFSDEGGEIIRDANGNPTGLFNENAEDVIAKFIPANDSERMTKAFELATQTCLKNGITGFHDAGVGREVINFYKSQYALGKFGLRMYVMVTGWDRDLVHEWFKKGPEVDPKHWLTIRSIKLNCDGALGSRGAWLLEPYT
ncbi:MAG TPA: amidohydrolase family protein, partial [Cyclobacteriaceae bacterium]|nr:amidohydrolase family protein [Cyclobacteriaceae bacterium]